MATGQPWTGADVIALRNAIEAGASRADLAGLFPHPLEGIRRKAIRLGLKFPRAIRKSQEGVEAFREPTPDANARATILLGEAIKALIAKTRPADLHRLGINTPPRIVEPGTENPLRGQAAERRLAA
jgi:hypothetical protein